MSPVEATHTSKCPVCGEWIAVGEEIVWDEEAEDWIHGECA